MKRVFTWIAWIVGAYWVIAAGCVVACNYWNWGVGEKYIITTAIQFFAGAATFLAVVISLFGASIRRKFDIPSIAFNVTCDDEHLVLRKDANSTASSSPVRVLEIYASAKNVKSVEAKDVQLICNKAFVSQDGAKFIHAKTLRAASFRWLYSSDDKKYLTTLRRSVEKYAKVVEVIDREKIREEEGKAGDGVGRGQEKFRDIHFEICLSMNDNANSSIELGAEYRAVLLSLCLASSSSAPAPYYLKIYLKSGDLESMPTADRLEIRMLTEQEAKDAVSVKLD